MWKGIGAIQILRDGHSIQFTLTASLLFTIHEHGSKLFIYTSMKRVWRETIGVDGEPISPKDAIFYKGKLYWLHLRIVSKEDALYVFKMYSLDIESNMWNAHSIYIGRRKRSMCITIH